MKKWILISSQPLFYFAFLWFKVHGLLWRLRRLFLEDGILVSQPSPLGEGAPQGRIGWLWYKDIWDKVSRSLLWELQVPRGRLNAKMRWSLFHIAFLLGLETERLGVVRRQIFCTTCFPLIQHTRGQPRLAALACPFRGKGWEGTKRLGDWAMSDIWHLTSKVLLSFSLSSLTLYVR